jgi:uracil-DNA glycosylase family 4
MNDSTKEIRKRAGHIIEQTLKSLHRAGVTHIKKVPIPLPAAPTHAVRVIAPSPRSPPVVRTQKKKVLPSLTQILQLEQSGDPRCQSLAAVAQEVSECTRCAELARTRTQTVFGVGNPYARLVFCGEAPGADEDRLGEPFVGRAGQLLTDIIVKGMKMRREDVYILNILRCRPPENRTPLPVEAAACREYLDQQLAIIQPEFICCLGACAAQHLLQTNASIGRLRGRIHDFHGIKVVCTYHPAYLLRNPAAKKEVWNDIQILMKEMGMKRD